MIWKYGNAHTSEPGEVTVSNLTQQKIYSPRGRIAVVRKRMVVEGILHGEDPDELTDRLENLEAVYAQDSRDAGLFHEDGTTPTAHFFKNNQTLGGVRVVNFDYPKGDGAEYTTYRTYQITVEADFAQAENNLLFFEETVEFIGTGGPQRVFLPVLNGPPQEQIVRQKTTIQATQSGRATGFLSYPLVPTPLWPQAEHKERRRVGRKSPQDRRGKKTDFEVMWNFAFEAVTLANIGPNAL